MKALVGAFNQEKALVGAFSVIVQPVMEPMGRFAALILSCPGCDHPPQLQAHLGPGVPAGPRPAPAGRQGPAVRCVPGPGGEKQHRQREHGGSDQLYFSSGLHHTLCILSDCG